MKIIFNDKSKHPAWILEQVLITEGFKKWFTISRWMGIYIPGLCVAFLLIAGRFVHLGYLK